MANTWVVDMRDYLDESGGIVGLPTPARRLADHFGAIVVAMSDRTTGKVVRTHVKCRRRPGRRPCAGFLEAVIEHELRMIWECPVCGDNGAISGWQGTPWDLRGAGRAH